MKEQVRQRIESLERELQGLKDELQPEIEVGSWWVGNGSGEKAKVIKIDKGCVSYTYNDDTYQYTYSIQDFLKNLTPCEAPKPEIEVGSWWFGNQSEEKVQVTKIDKKRVHYTYEDGCEGALKFHNFTNRFTPCEAPEPKIEAASWWRRDVSGEKAKLTKVDKKRVHYTYEDGTANSLSLSDFPNYFTPCEAPEPKIEVASWWRRDVSGEKAKLTKVDKKRVHYTYEDGTANSLSLSGFTEFFTPCEAPKKETWYLCTKDLGVNKFKRGEEYKMVCENPLTLIDEKDYPNRILGWGVYFVSPQER
jgi:translation elongation factor P/translation initiation factor 5A